MLGAIIGDIIGSPYEWKRIKTTDFPLFSDRSHATDDSILTIATAEAILSGEPYGRKYWEYGRRYPGAGYGGRFCGWLGDARMLPYNSLGNGSAMRVSPVAWAFDDGDRVREEARRSAEPTHNHPEGIKGAQAIAALIHAARTGKDKEVLRRIMKDSFGYTVDVPVDELRPTYGMDETCPGTVPQAFRCVYEASSYEEAVRLAVSLGGDSDTLACIAGSVAEALWGIPDHIVERGLHLLHGEHPELLPAIKQFWKTHMMEKVCA